jgi:Uri superfamily endonuclease
MMVMITLCDAQSSIVERDHWSIDFVARTQMAPLRAALQAGEVERGLAQAVVTVGTLLRARFPQSEDEQVEDIDELPNRPHVI